MTIIKRHIILIFAALVAYCFLFQGARGLFEKDEGRYTAIAMNMLRSGDWIHPRLQHELEHFSKPPLTYWAIAASLKVLGHSEFAARFPSAAGFLGTVIAVYFLGLIFLPQQRWIPPLVYATFFFAVTASNIITTDGLLTFFEVSAMACFAHAYWRPARRQAALIGMWTFFALAFLTKGPPGLLPLIAILTFVFWNRKNVPAFKLNWFVGMLILLTIGGSWYLYVMGEKASLAEYFVRNEVVGRVFSKEHNRNANWFSFVYVYIPILIFGTLPWTKWVFDGCRKAWSSIREPRAATTDPSVPQDVFLLLWVTIPLSIFTIAQSRLALYILPLFAPLALLAAREIVRAQVPLMAWRGRIAGWMLAMLALRLAGGLIPIRQDASWYARELTKHFPEPVEEVVFIDKRPVMGLEFYLQAEVEEISMVNGTLEDEMSEKEKRVWIVKPEHKDLFPRLSADVGHPVMLLSKFDWDQDYYLFVEK